MPSSVPGTLPPRPWLGVIFHPEHRPVELWPEDIRQISEAGLTVARLADTAWSILEPSAERFDFEWLDRAIELLAAAGIATVLTTSASSPPSWLVRQHPNMIAEPMPGGRSHSIDELTYCVNSPEMHAAVTRLVRSLAEHFGSNAHVIGWQTESDTRVTCYCDRCQSRFREFLSQRHGSLNDFNQRARAGSLTRCYSAWEEITATPRQDDPGLVLEWRRFQTESHARFLNLQTNLLRQHLLTGAWITHNATTSHSRLDPYALAQAVDLPSMERCMGGEQHDHRRCGTLADLTAGLKRRSFLVTESPLGATQPGDPDSFLYKEETQALAWQAVAHGAEGLICWPWRPAPAAPELCHGTLLDHAGQPRPFLEEIRILGLEFSALSDWLADSERAKARVAIVNSCDSRWTSEVEHQATDFDYGAHLEHWHRPIAARNIAVDIIPPDANLDQYKLVIAPALSVLNDQIVKNFKELVGHSGHLILTIKTGTRDEHAALLASRQPGPLSAIAGVEVEEYYALQQPIPVKGNWFEGVAQHWAERLRILDPNKAVKVARYGACNGWLDDELAITVCAQGTGLVYMIGVYLDEAAQQEMVDHFLQNAGLPKIETPPGVEIRVRVRSNGQQLYVVINHTRSTVEVSLPSQAENPLTGQEVKGAFRLAPYGVAVLLKR